MPNNNRNFIDNASFDVWQRGTSFAIASSTRTMVADRWKAVRTGATDCTISRQTGFSGAPYCLRWARNAASTTIGTMRLWHQLLPAIPEKLQGKIVRVSFDVRALANYSGGALTAAIHSGTLGGEAADISSNAATVVFVNGGVLQTVSSTITPTTTVQRIICDAATLGTIIKDLAIRFSWVPSGTAGAADGLEITNVKLEIGNIATAFEPESMAEIMLRCQRAYQTAGQAMAGNVAVTNTQVTVYGKFPVPMYQAPTLSLLDTVVNAFRNGIPTSSSGATLASQSSKATGYMTATITGFSAGTTNHIVTLASSGHAATFDIFGLDAEILD